ncbi:hypothetical protein M2146_001584 [Lachnospiraceae bacterium PF1-22]|uniref:hypothetical protein n=1 Tax=Ohessyouella blattaphilus TaxID=2949333 RepID=UPI003E1E27CD
MENIKYNQDFEYQENEQGQLVFLKNTKDKYQMNWLNRKEVWGKVIMPEGLTLHTRLSFTEEGKLREQYVFSNETQFDVFVQKNSIGIYTTFPDDYVSAKQCMTERCHAHVWCGRETTYLYGLRMGGEGPHLGLVLTEGSVDGYSIVRDEEQRSNDRGCILLHPEAFHLRANESYVISWELLWFAEEKQFFDELNKYKHTALVSVDKIVALKNEKTTVFIEKKQGTNAEGIEVYANGQRMEVSEKGNFFFVQSSNRESGEVCWDINVNGHSTSAKTLVMPEIEVLAQKRCEYIVNKQQYHEEGSHLDGSLLVYDTEDEKIYYSHMPDHNGGRERVGMGVLLAKYLQKHTDENIERGLDKYTAYIRRELFDEKDGTVFNDVSRNNDWHRIYNYPWMSVFFMERFKLYGLREDLVAMYKTMVAYYRNGGIQNYSIGIPIVESVFLLNENSMSKEAAQLTELYCDHAGAIVETGLNYPPHEVNYEQSIVAPGVSVLLQVYSLTQDDKYLQTATEQMKVLELFNGKQPDYHLYETAIRHWDGFWFGKSKLLGDTFPHYWSVISGEAFLQYWKITDEERYLEKAKASIRGGLSLFSESGEATCAYLYPQSVNGRKGDFADPWANDQDWALYYYLKEEQYIGKRQGDK